MRTLKIIMITLILVSCGTNTGESNSPIYGTWQITESLADPGDGSGTFQNIDSSKTLTFNSNGTVMSNENVCIGNFFTPGKTADLDLNTKSFNLGGCKATYDLDGDILEVRYQCMEACAERYRRKN